MADDLYESLDGERAPVRRFNPHWVWPVAAAAALAIAVVQFSEEEQPEPAFTLGMAKDGDKADDQPKKQEPAKPFTFGKQPPNEPHPAVRVRLERGGLLEVETDPDGWMFMSFDELGRYMRRRADHYDKDRRNNGASGWKRIGRDTDVSVMRVYIESHEDGQWQDARRVLRTMVKQHYNLLVLAVDDKLVDASLPVDLGIGGQRPKFKIQVAVIRTPVKGGGFSPVEYRFNGLRTNKLEEVAGWIADARKEAAPKMRVEGEIFATDHAPQNAVARVTYLLRRHGCDAVLFRLDKPPVRLKKPKVVAGEEEEETIEDEEGLEVEIDKEDPR